MCISKKKCSLEPILRYLEGFFDCVGSPLSGSRASLKDIYGDLLTSLYQLDDDGNKVVIDCSEDDSNFVIDVGRPVYVGSLRDNSESKFVTEGFGDSNLYDDISSLGFKPVIKNNNNNRGSELLQSFIIDAPEDSVLPVSYDEDGDYYVFSDKVEARCLPKVNFYIYRKSDGEGGYVPAMGGFGIECVAIQRNGSDYMGYLVSHFEFEETGAIDEFGNFISRAKASVLMLPTDNYDNSFKLFGRSEASLDFDTKIEEYYFDDSVSYGEEVDAKGKRGLVDVRFVNEDEQYADLVPTDSCQFIGTINEDFLFGFGTVYLGYKWDTGLNDKVYCHLDSSISIRSDAIKKYVDASVRYYISNSVKYGLYNVKHFGDKQMYLYNINSEGMDDISIVDNALELPVGRLPIVDLTGKLSKSAFDSSKPYIYVFNTSIGPDYSTFLCEYKDLDSDLVFQGADNSCYSFSNDTEFFIVCSATAPNVRFMKKIVTPDDSYVYRLICRSTGMNEVVNYILRAW